MQLHTDARYESTPTTLKTVLLVAHLLALVALLVVAWRTWRGNGRPVTRPRFSPADALVVGVSAVWAVLGPVNIDDSWYALMARNADAAGYVGNYIYQFNVTENPFSTSQYLMQFWGSLGEAIGMPGWGLVWLRVLPVDWPHAAAVERLPLHHRDPFDRLIVAQAQRERLAVVTKDAAFRTYDIRVVW